MKINHNIIDNISVLILQGRLDTVTAFQVRERLGVLGGPNRKIVLDMKRVEFIDSSGLGALVASVRWMRELNGDLKLACLNTGVRQVFELTRAFRLFDIFDSTAAAVESSRREEAA